MDTKQQIVANILRNDATNTIMKEVNWMCRHLPPQQARIELTSTVNYILEMMKGLDKK